ncbi:MAG TPA: glucosamine-6-phosphate deaminase [Flavitalea sp.]|nr:glucosamine-6-phosphate deaminase [Flavitalea sp.]
MSNVFICENAQKLGEKAGQKAGESIKAAINERGQANIILATGASQFETLKTLINQNIDWSKVVMFHLDEYIGLPESSPASFRRYLKERFIAYVPPLKAVYLINGEEDTKSECERLNSIIINHPVDVALVGIGENGHLAFNDPPADFEIEDPYIIVTLNNECRQQQFNEGWFESINDVPRKAISMSIKHICKSSTIICSVPDNRKATAVKKSLEEKVNNLVPASILQSHQSCFFYLDRLSSSLLTKQN